MILRKRYLRGFVDWGCIVVRVGHRVRAFMEVVLVVFFVVVVVFLLAVIRYFRLTLTLTY